MADIINLRLVRKAKLRADKARAADVNRAKFGQTRAERQAQQQEQDRRDRQLDGSLREKGEGKSE